MAIGGQVFRREIMVFTAKKVEALPSFGERIKKAREEADLTKEKVGQLLNIRVGYLEKLESGEFEKLPADVYTRGVLRKYAKILGTEPETLLAEYEKEIKIIRHLNKTKQHQSLPSLRSSRFIITPRTFSFLFLTLIFLLVAGYLFYQLYFLISPPALVIFEPAGDLVIQNTAITIKGKTEPGARLTINGQQIYIDKDGGFEQAVNLNQGLNSIKIEAMNRFEKTSSVVRQVMVR
ncbi:MAG: cytoskeleton protein RodZ [Parcubacteria group bacterium LiPW_39]|nr:MAG: cytoskeleton protein RodZ [Parcubacteria group bacterium LiPW_39]